MNPFMMGLLSMTGATDPAKFAETMAAAGISPSMLGGAGSGMSQFGGLQPQDPLGGFITGDALQSAPATTEGWDATVTPTPAPSAPVPANPMSMLSGLQGVKTPQAPQPIMSGSVGGRAPEMQKVGNSALQAAIMSMIAGGGAQPQVGPGLGQLIQQGT